MTQFHSDDFKMSRQVMVKTEERAKRTRGIGAFLVSLLFFVPLLPLIGVFMGAGARSANGRSGTRSSLATSAIVLGLVLTIVQAFVGLRGYGYFQQLNDGPGDALTAGFGGNASSFTDHFLSGSTDDAVRASFFLEDLRRRFGHFRSAQIQRPLTGDSLAGPHRYLLVFDGAIVHAEASLTTNTTLGLDWYASKLEYMIVEDAKQGDLVFPVTKKAMLTKHPDAH